MPTTTTSLESPEAKAARISKNRAAGLEKARAAKAAKALNTPTINPELVQQLRIVPSIEFDKGIPSTNGNKIWREAFFIAMKNYQVKSANDLNKCSSLADKVIAEMKAQNRIS